MSTENPFRVLIAGGGVGGIEAALALRTFNSQIDVEMLAPNQHFVYRPMSVGEPFNLSGAWQIELEDIADDCHFVLRRDALDHVTAGVHRVLTQGGRMVEYNALILALGAIPEARVPGAFTFRGPQDAHFVAQAVRAFKPGKRYHVVFATPDATTWTLPLYELALMTQHWGKDRGLDLDIKIVTTEESALAVFGDQNSREVSDLLAARGIGIQAQTLPMAVENGHMRLFGEKSIPADLAIALPGLKGPRLEGIESNEQGFVDVDPFGHVKGWPDLYAIGDMTSYPVKQGGLATQQADVVASTIAAQLDPRMQPPKPFEPVLRAMLLTGEEPRFLRNPHEIETEFHRPDGENSLAPWWPQQKVMGRFLAPYLATHGHMIHSISNADLGSPVTSH